ARALRARPRQGDSAMKLFRALVPFVLAAAAASASAAHATTRLDSLAAAVSARGTDGLSSAQKKALASAAKLLAKTTKTESADAAVAKGVKAAVGAENWMVASVDGAPFVSEITQGLDLSGFLSLTGTDYVGRFFVGASHGIDLSAHGVTATGGYPLDDGTTYK